MKRLLRRTVLILACNALLATIAPLQAAAGGLTEPDARVQAIALNVMVTKKSAMAEARVIVTDSSGTPLSGVEISGQWDGAVTGNATGTSDSKGVALLKSNALRKGGTATFTVSGLGKNSSTFDPSKNLITSASVTVGSNP